MAAETKHDVTARKGSGIQKAVARRMLSPVDEMDRLLLPLRDRRR
jgi:hypothetical protein